MRLYFVLIKSSKITNSFKHVKYFLLTHTMSLQKSNEENGLELQQ